MLLLLRNILILITGFVSTHAFAQDNCKDALYEADRLFESGKITECIDRLKPCTKTGTDKNTLIESYHLLALAYQTLNNLDMANSYIKKLLSLKPDYQKYPNIDPIDFSRLVNQYQVSPKLYLGLKAGFNINSIALHKSYSLYPSTQRYNPAAAYQVGIMGDYRLNPMLSINADLLFSSISINHIIDSAGYWKQNYKEKQNYFMLTMAAVKHFKLYKNLDLFAGIGIAAGFLNRANVSLDAINTETQTIQQATKDPTKERNRFQPCLDVLAGLNYPIAQGDLSIETCFLYFFRNTVADARRFSDINFIFNNQYVNDDISLRPVMVNVIYKFPLTWAIRLKK